MGEDEQREVAALARGEFQVIGDLDHAMTQGHEAIVTATLAWIRAAACTIDP